MNSITLPYNYQPRDYQLPLLEALDSGKKYAAIVWARRHGKDLTCWNYAIKTAARYTMDIVYIYPTSEMAKDNLWEAKTNDGREFMDFIPMQIRQRVSEVDDGLNNTFKQVTFYNNSTIKLKSAERPNRLRGGNPKLYVISEYAEMDPAVLDVIEPVVEANGGQILINFTPRGDNHARGSYESWSKDKDWFTQVIKATDTNVFTGEQLEKIQARLIDRFVQIGRSETEAQAFFDQEYMCSFDSPVIGSYYGAALRLADSQKRITKVPWEPNLPVDTYWDLGVGDSTAIWFGQSINREVRMIDYYETTGEGVAHYIKKLREKPYVYGEHIAPFDIEVQEFGSGRTRRQAAQDLGFTFRIAPRLAREEGIEAARSIMSSVWFDQKNCERGVSALKNYHKEWDDKNKTYKDRPAHDWSSHGADAFRYFAISHRPQQADEEPPDDTKRMFNQGFY